MDTENAKEILPNIKEIVIFAKENKIVMGKDGKPTYYQISDHNGGKWFLWLPKFANANVELGKAYLIAFSINDKGYPEVETIRLVQNVFHQNAIKELQSRSEIIRNLSVALSYSKDFITNGVLEMGELYNKADEIYQYLQDKTDKEMGIK